MQRLISSVLLVVFGLFCFLPQTVTANPSMSAQKATEIAKSIISIPDDVKNFRSNYSEYNGRGVWSLNWETEEGNISVSVDALSGEINHFSKYINSSDSTSLLPTVDRKTAINIANKFLAKAVPSKYSLLNILEDDNYETYNYSKNIVLNYQRMVNNIPYLQNSAYFNISGDTGEVISFNLSWDYDVNFTTNKGIISQEKAENVLKDKALELIYYKPYGPKNQVYLVYGVKQPTNSFVNAHTGEYTELSHYYRIMADKAMGNVAAGGEVAPELSPIELEEIDLIKGLISKDEAINIVKKHIEIPDSYDLIHSALYQDYQNKDKRRWSFEWQNSTEDKSGYISAAIDAKSGELISFYISNYSPERQNQKANYSREEARKIAEEFIAHINPQKAKQIKFNEQQQQGLLMEINLRAPDQPNPDLKEISFEFIRLVNDIPFYDDKFNLTVDLITGEIISYNYHWSNYNFPSPNKIINKDEAFNKLTNDNSITLQYIQPFGYSGQGINKKVGLYYHFSNSEPRLVDAFKGILLNNSGEEFKKKTTPRLNDIKGHPAEDDINTLLSLGIIAGNEDGLFLPNNSITNAEFIKMLVMGIGAYPGEGRKIESLGDEWYSPYYQTAINRKIISKDNIPPPHEHLTRINAAYMLIKAMNLAYIADLQGIYKLSAADINTIKEKDIGYIAITSELGLIPLKNKQALINEVMLRGESASTIAQLMRINKR